MISMIIKMGKKVFLRNIDEKLYAALKAKASLLGITASQAVNEAIKLWLQSPGASSQPAETLQEKARKLAQQYCDKQGYLVAVNDAAQHYLAASLQEAVQILRKLHEQGNLKNSIIVPLKPQKKIIETGGGLLEIRRTL